ncbi:hypothetical protein [Streptomyces sp. NPDC003077]|uniref:alpha/beta hydrolase family protein n=1 Tax=Streptomyces sp. NPDC003077 TaxID=3154443 RepID=UPI0033A3F37B
MRLGTAAATAATTVLGAGMAAVAAGRYASDTALKPSPDRPFPGDPRLTVHAVGIEHVTLTRSLASLRPGTYGLTGDGCHVVIGDVMDGVPRPADTVVRRLKAIVRGDLEPGAKLRVTPQVHIGNPRDALGLPYKDVLIPGELGPLPAWYLPGRRATWVITAHGLGTTREHPMVIMPLLQRFHLPILNLAYRNDPGAPHTADGINHLGDSEWRDLDAAIRYACAHGAECVILYGWSTGATMALHAAAGTGLRDHIRGLVLDSPVLDWRATVRALAAARRVPGPLLPLAVRAAEGSTGLHAGRLTDVVSPRFLAFPTLLAHGPGDTIAPWSASRNLVALRSDLFTLHEVPDAPHGAMWNADPAGYEEALRRFLTPLL